MKNRLKKKIALIVALMTMFVFGLNTNPLKPKAADVSVVISISASSVKVGDTVSVTVSVSGSSLSAYTMYVGYNSGVLQYVSCSGMGNGGGGSVTLSGTGSSSSATITFKPQPAFPSDRPRSPESQVRMRRYRSTPKRPRRSSRICGTDGR